jgi:hypothetical protein
MTASLADLQTLFQDRLLGTASAIDRHLRGGGPFLSVYDTAYAARLLEVMGEDFPGVHTLLGDDEFAEAARAYIRANPSGERSVRWLGRAFADWLRTTPPWSALPVLGDMAAFEWLLGLAFDAPDAEPLSRDALAAVAPETWPVLRFVWHPALATATLGHDVSAFHRACADGGEPDAAPATLDTPLTWAAWRAPETYQVRYRDLAAEEAAALSAATAGGVFADLCDAIAEASQAPDQAAMRAAALTGQWVDAGWIAGLEAEGMSLSG